MVLVACVAMVGFWEWMSSRGGVDTDAFGLVSASFAEFLPSPPGWQTESLRVSRDPIEPNIKALKMSRPSAPGDRGPVLVRLVHGYNMVDCMRIKGYQVDLVEDRRHEARAGAPSETGGRHPLRVQIWRLTSSAGDVSLWVTSMLRAVDFSLTDTDTRSMAFPRVGTPDDPSWIPRGLTSESLKNPVSGIRLFLRAKWNASRCDPMVFLGLRRPAWASDEMLTLVSATSEIAPTVSESDMMAHVLDAHAALYGELLAWRRSRPVK